ncbi:metal-dependent hydrolase [Amnimonas aquatica]|uniref:Metal-dependent hydrolase n=1 Tax=Amnimonas aquatica TaxID=2094561 RepID=A0A2P6AR46_9GAMM|nr:metal-dependent hydrolase [Amnimonas aquatica]PQA34253.1 metal-dependent hydrolase [Amnimonas aquatica]
MNAAVNAISNAAAETSVQSVNRQPLGARVGIPPRRVALDLKHSDAGYWYANDPFLTYYWSAFSILLPEGEQFFVEAVRHYRDQITDENLKAGIAGFIGQEALHTQGHQVLNKFIEDKNLPAAEIEAQLRVLLDTAAKIHPRLSLAATICLEHFTALLGEQLLVEEDHHNSVNEDIKPLWMWHALEETEHKAVAWDVYEQTGGSYAVRAGTMVVTTAVLGAVMAYATARLLHADGKLLDVRNNWRGFKSLFGRQGRMTRLAPKFLDFFRPGFHPNDHDTKALVAEWRERLFGVNGEVNHLLKGRVVH